MGKEKNYFKEKKIWNKIKKILVIILVVSIVAVIIFGFIGQDNKTIKVSGAFALYPMMNMWVEEYEEEHSDIRIDVSAGGAGKGMSDAINGIVDMGMVSRDIYQQEIDQGIFWISVAKDAVVATINSNNPVVDIILKRGITKQEFIDIFITRNIKTWGELVNDPSITNNIKVYSRSDACGAAKTWAKYLGNYSQDDLQNNADSAIDGDPNLAAIIQGDVNGIGFNNINFVYDADSKKPYDSIIPVPIDLNENGTIDDFENFYETRDEIVDSIANNVYPSPPARDLHLVTKNSFTGIVKDFVYWILTDGQKYVTSSGYIKLSQDKIDQQLQYLEQGSRPETSS